VRDGLRSRADVLRRDVPPRRLPLTRANSRRNRPFTACDGTRGAC
jgi:hypothetical protein